MGKEKPTTSTVSLTSPSEHGVRRLLEPGRHLAVAAAYDVWAPSYDNGNNPMVCAATEIVADLLDFAAGRDVVELGCGTGRNLVGFKEAGARSATGCDLSEAMLAEAARLSSDLQLHHCDFAAETPIADCSADLVLFCLTLEHICDLRPPLVEAHRIVRPGGLIVMVEIHPALSATGIMAHFEWNGSLITMPTYPHSLTALHAAISSAGLTTVSERTWRRMDFASQHPKMAKHAPERPFVIELRAVR